MLDRVIGGKVRLVEKLASGGMGDVYRGRHLVMGVDVAVKVLEPVAHPDPDALGRFRAEAHVSALLAHRSVVRVFDLLEEPDGTLALVMELLVGRTLEQKLRDATRLEPEIALAIAAPILGALEHAHAVGVIHRDVKPGNVFLAVEPDGRVVPKLLDFGVAKFDGQTVKTMEGNVVGTSRYMSPEQVRGDPLDARSDLFSMGAILYEAMSGTSPFSASHVGTALRKVLEQTVDADEHIPPRVWLVIQKALSKQPYERPASASAMASALLAALGKTEEQLAGNLKEDPPPLPKLDTSAAWSTRSGARSVKTRPGWPLALGATAFVVMLALLAMRFIPSRAAASPVPPAATEAPPPLVSLPPPPTASAAPAPTQQHAHVRPIGHPKAVATTPGF